MNEFTPYVVLWQTRKGERMWEVLEKDTVNNFCVKLLTDGVDSASIIIAYMPVIFHWLFPEHHGGLSDVNFGRLNRDICGKKSKKKSNHKPVEVERTPPKQELKYGWLSPDGRFFNCDYGGHIQLAQKIVGEVECVLDPELHLEERGWARIVRDTVMGEKYMICMGQKQTLTDSQIKTLEREGLSDCFGIEIYLWRDGE